jgi:hypothetical protein
MSRFFVASRVAVKSRLNHLPVLPRGARAAGFALLILSILLGVGASQSAPGVKMFSTNDEYEVDLATGNVVQQLDWTGVPIGPFRGVGCIHFRRSHSQSLAMRVIGPACLAVYTTSTTTRSRFAINQPPFEKQTLLACKEILR